MGQEEEYIVMLLVAFFYFLIFFFKFGGQMLGVGISWSVEPQEEVMGWVSLGHYASSICVVLKAVYR